MFSEENKEHPKTQHTRKQAIPRTCVFGCVAFSGALFRFERAPKHTRKRNTPEIADCGNGLFSGVLRFRVCFGACKETFIFLFLSLGARNYSVAGHRSLKRCEQF